LCWFSPGAGPPGRWACGLPARPRRALIGAASASPLHLVLPLACSSPGASTSTACPPSVLPCDADGGGVRRHGVLHHGRLRVCPWRVGLVVASGFSPGPSRAAISDPFGLNRGWADFRNFVAPGSVPRPCRQWTYAHRRGLRMERWRFRPDICLWGHPTGLVVIVRVIVLLLVLGLIELIGRLPRNPIRGLRLASASSLAGYATPSPPGIVQLSGAVRLPVRVATERITTMTTQPQVYSATTHTAVLSPGPWRPRPSGRRPRSAGPVPRSRAAHSRSYAPVQDRRADSHDAPPASYIWQVANALAEVCLPGGHPRRASRRRAASATQDRGRRAGRSWSPLVLTLPDCGVPATTRRDRCSSADARCFVPPGRRGRLHGRKAGPGAQDEAGSD